MHVVLVWFADRPRAPEECREARLRLADALSHVVDDGCPSYEAGGADWGLHVRYPTDHGAWRWPVVAHADGLTAVSAGVPVGLDHTGGPVALARRLLDGYDVQVGVLPPFGLVAVDSAHTVVIQQDWLGMCRLFTGTADGVTVLASRPSLVPVFLGRPVEPDLAGWASYAVCGQFGGDMSPVTGVRLLRPGERVSAHRAGGGGWRLTSASRQSVDDVVMAGVQARHLDQDKKVELAAQGLTDSVGSLFDLYREEISLGLSGGKDSRVLAASVIAAGRLPRLFTHEDVQADGDTARTLVRLLRTARGLTPEHHVYLAGAPAEVTRVGLYERIDRLHALYDYQYPSNYTIRPASPTRLPDLVRVPSLSGAGGELATGHWYPRHLRVDDDDRSTAHRVAATKLLSALPPDTAAAFATAQERDRLADLLRHGAGLGLHGLHLVDYVYLVERTRRWYTSAYATGIVTPYLSPGFVAASFALTADQKRGRYFHTALLHRLLPEWAEVPFVTGSAGPSTVVKIWAGDGVPVIADLLDTAQGRIARLVRRPAVERNLAACLGSTGTPDPKTLQQFAFLAVAAQRLEPSSTVQSSGATYARLTRLAAQPVRPVPRAVSVAARPWRFIRRTRAGARLWTAVRGRVTQAR